MTGFEVGHQRPTGHTFDRQTNAILFSPLEEKAQADSVDTPVVTLRKQRPCHNGIL